MLYFGCLVSVEQSVMASVRLVFQFNNQVKQISLSKRMKDFWTKGIIRMVYPPHPHPYISPPPIGGGGLDPQNVLQTSLKHIFEWMNWLVIDSVVYSLSLSLPLTHCVYASLNINTGTPSASRGFVFRLMKLLANVTAK